MVEATYLSSIVKHCIGTPVCMAVITIIADTQYHYVLLEQVLVFKFTEKYIIIILKKYSVLVWR